MEFAAGEARRKQAEAKRRGAKDAHGLVKKTKGIEMEIGGSQSEFAVSLLLGVEWAAYRRGGPDVGERTQVRSSMVKRKSHNLIIRPYDLKLYGDVPFVLVIQDGNRFEVLGWIMAGDAKQVGRWWDGGNGRSPAYFVHESGLRPISELENP